MFDEGRALTRAELSRAPKTEHGWERSTSQQHFGRIDALRLGLRPQPRSKQSSRHATISSDDHFGAVAPLPLFAAQIKAFWRSV
jgi:hypothetical protein